MSRLVIRQEGSSPDVRVMVKCGGPGLRTVFVKGLPETGKSVKDVIKTTVARAEELVAIQRV